MSEPNDPETPTTLDSAMEYLRQGGGYDVVVAGLLLSHGVPIPPSIVKRVRLGLGRLIDGSFDVLTNTLKRAQARSDFAAKLEQDVVHAIAQAGTQKLAKDSPGVQTTVALSLLRDYGLKFDNKAAVAREALATLISEPPTHDPAPDKELDADWLNHFSDIAAQKSAPEMQRLMGRILAGEIRKPGSFSPLSVSVLATLTPTVAHKFEDLCRVAITINGGHAAILIDAFKEFRNSGIPEIGFTYIDLLTLQSHILLTTATDSNWTVSSGVPALISNCGQSYVLTGNFGAPHVLPIAVLSQVGVELQRLLAPAPLPWFSDKLSALFSPPNWTLVPVASAVPPA